MGSLQFSEKCTVDQFLHFLWEEHCCTGEQLQGTNNDMDKELEFNIFDFFFNYFKLYRVQIAQISN